MTVYQDKILSVVRASVLLLLTIVSLVGCGYTFQGSGSVLPPDVKTVIIPLVENATTEANLTTLVTEALRDKFEQYGAVQVVDSYADADAVLSVKILKLKRSSGSTTARTDTAVQQESTLILSAELKRTSGMLLRRSSQLSVSQAYGITAGSVLTTSASFAAGGLNASDLAGIDNRELSRGQEQEALTGMAESAAKKIYDDFVAPDF
jgi:outer membrane lipopolysaccharide assembly protein LptE/RlpB